MTKRVIHVMFGDSGAGSLRKAIEMGRRDEIVVAIAEDYSLGPLADEDARSEWMAAFYEYDWQELKATNEAAIATCLNSDARLVAWISWRDVPVLCNFLHWLWQIGDTPCEIVDVSELFMKRRNDQTERPYRFVSPSMISAEKFEEYGLFESAVPLEPEERTAYHALWRRLQAENALLRVADGTSVTSAEITHFDDHILSRVTSDWQKIARAIGNLLADQIDQENYKTGGTILWRRILALIESGAIKARGNLSLMHESEIRLPGGGTAPVS